MKILIIHNPETDRHERLMNELNSQGIDVSKDVVFIAPVYLKEAKHGICQAHKNCVRYAQEKGLKNIIIMENDIHFTHSNSFKYFLEVFKTVPDDWQIYLGGVYQHGQKKQISNCLQRITCFSALHFYSVNETFYERFLQMPDDKHIDTSLGYSAKNYLCYPIPSIQHDGYSENFRRYLYHEKWTKKLNLYNGKEQNCASGNCRSKRRI